MTKRKKPIIPPMKYMENIMPREPKKRGPLAGLKKKHPGPWRVKECIGGWAVFDKNDKDILFCRSLALARAIAKLGGGK